VISWQHDDPLPPWGHGPPRDDSSIDWWIALVICVFALAGLILSLAFAID
jgi:hypothetical protein